MIKENFTYNLLRFKENSIYNQKLHAITIFPYENIHTAGTLTKMILNLSLKEVDFNKKRALPFFLAMELLTNQKCIATLSSKNIITWKLRKGALVGCKVTLRNTNLFEFIDNLNLTFPRMEKFKGIDLHSFIKKPTNAFSLIITELILFYPVELGLGINTEVKKIEIKFLFKNFSSQEKIFLLTTNRLPLNIK